MDVGASHGNLGVRFARRAFIKFFSPVFFYLHDGLSRKGGTAFSLTIALRKFRS